MINALSNKKDKTFRSLFSSVLNSSNIVFFLILSQCGDFDLNPSDSFQWKILIR